MALPLRKSDAPADTTAGGWHCTAALSGVEHGQVTVQLEGREQAVFVATHIGHIAPGQSLMVIVPVQGMPLVVAAYPAADGAGHTSTQAVPTAVSSAMHFDAETQTLSIQAPNLRLEGVSVVELRCGEAVLKLTAQNELFAQAETITHAAVGPFRIEGASIDLN
jgi:hypothetical protein